MKDKYGTPSHVEIKEAPSVGQEHGITVGRIFPVACMADDEETPYLFVMGDAGEEVGLFVREYRSATPDDYQAYLELQAEASAQPSLPEPRKIVRSSGSGTNSYNVFDVSLCNKFGEDFCVASYLLWSQIDREWDQYLVTREERFAESEGSIK